MLNPIKEIEQRCVDCKHYAGGFWNKTGRCYEQTTNTGEIIMVKETALCNIDKFEPKNRRDG